jgi:hypothetical protein
MAGSTSPISAMDQTIEDLLFELKHYRQFPAPSNNYLHNPYVHAMIKIQSFTSSVIAFLEQPGTSHHSLVSIIQEIYNDLPSFHEILKFGKWIKDAMLKHPLQRTAKQYQWLAIVNTITELGILEGTFSQIVLTGLAAIQEWHERVLSPSNLPIDQPNTYIFTHKHGITTPPLPLHPTFDNTHCPICFLLFSSDTVVPQAAPCAHILCSKCFPRWIAKATKTCTCPLCRACLVCGNATYPCPWHTLREELELVPPTPLPTILDQVLVEKRGEVLHGIRPEKYFVLREATRRDRTTLKRLSRWMDIAVRQGDYAGRARVKVEYEGVAERVREEVVKTLETS